MVKCHQISYWVRLIISIIIIIIEQPCCPVVGQKPRHTVSKLACLALSSARFWRSSFCPGRLSTAWLVSLVIFSCHMFSKWCHARFNGRLWYTLPKTISFFSQCWLYLWHLSSPWPRHWSFYPCMWCWACFFPFWYVPTQVCSVLVWSVSRSLHHNVIAGSTQELYTCLFRQMARLLLKISRCLAYAAQPAMHLRCISLSWFFSLML